MSIKRTPEETSELIFEKWKASLANRDRSKLSLAGNFDELFEKLKGEDVPFDIAHDLVDRASKAHRPSKFIVERSYKNAKQALGSVTIKEFEDDWKKMIDDTALTSFHDFYKTELDDEEEKAPKVYGNMSEKEYRAQRKHADSYPTLDTTELEKKFLERSKKVEDIEVEDLLGDDGGKPETKS